MPLRSRLLQSGKAAHARHPGRRSCGNRPATADRDCIGSVTSGVSVAFSCLAAPHHSALLTTARERCVPAMFGVGVAPAHEEPRSGSSSSAHESTRGPFHKLRERTPHFVHHAQAPAVLNSRALPQGDGRAGPGAHTVARHLAGIPGPNRSARAFNRQEHLFSAPQSRDWSAPHPWCFWVSQPCPRCRRLRAPPPSRGNKHSTTHAGPATRPRKATIAWVRTSTILSEGKPVPSRTTAIPAP